MDGNGRWARGRGLPVAEGHRAGTKALRQAVEAAIDLDVESLAVYAFSTENWSRTRDEIDTLMEIFGETIDREFPDLVRQGVRVRFIGRRDRAPEDLQRKMASLERQTTENTTLRLWIAFDYGGRAEIVEAARKLVESGVEPREIDENVFAAIPLRAGDARSRPAHSHVRRAACLELPAVAAGLHGARLRRPSLARLLAEGSRGRPVGLRPPPPSLRRAMSPLVTRLLVAAVGLPLVLAALWAGGWWLFALVVPAALLALHEFFAMTKPLRPIPLAGYAGLAGVLYALQETMSCGRWARCSRRSPWPSC